VTWTLFVIEVQVAQPAAQPGCRNSILDAPARSFLDLETAPGSVVEERRYRMRLERPSRGFPRLGVLKKPRSLVLGTGGAFKAVLKAAYSGATIN